MNGAVRIIVPLLAVTAVVAGTVIFTRKGNDASDESCATTSPKIVAFGDSLVAGYGATTEGGFVTMLSTEVEVPITNLGVNGDTSAQAKGRLNTVIAEKPDITLVLLGGNDVLRRIPQAETEQNLTDIIGDLQQSGSKVILLGVIGGFPRDPYASMFSRLAKTYGVTYVPNVLSGIIGHSDLMSDQVHPNEAGYQKIANKVLPALEKECSDLR